MDFSINMILILGEKNNIVLTLKEACVYYKSNIKVKKSLKLKKYFF